MYPARFILVCSSLFAVVMIGCRESTPAPKPATSQKRAGQQTEAEKCRDQLARAITRLVPEKLSFQDRPERAINGLNAWVSSCGREDLEGLILNEAALRLIESNPRTTARRFTANDSAYIRDCLVLRDLTTAIWTRTPVDNDGPGKDATRTKELFQWVVRNISLPLPDKERLPLGLFDVMLTGSGSAEDRAWVFVEGLRQQHIHTAFVVTTDAAAQETGSPLETRSLIVVVALEDGSMLFDPFTGTQLFSADEPLTTESLSQHDRWKQSHAQIVAQHAAFAARMLVLQDHLPADSSAVFFEELTGGVSQITALVDQAVSVGDGLWDKDSVVVWSYPESQTVAASSLSDEDTTAYQQLMQSFNAPFERPIVPQENFEELTTVPEELSPKQRQEFAQQRLMEQYIRLSHSSEDRFGKPSRRLLKVRIQQILGRVDNSVIQQLQQVRISSMEESIRIAVPEVIRREHGLPPVQVIPFPELIRQVNQSSTGNALYWSAMCQLDKGDIGVAITTLKSYQRHYENGRWYYPSMIHHAEALIRQDRVDDARSVLEKANVPENPEQARVTAMLESLS